LIALVLAGACSAAPPKPVPAPVPVEKKEPPPTPVEEPPAVPGDANTGFDLYVDPVNVPAWLLDGDRRTDRLPSRIRGLAPGKHVVVIEPPDGFHRKEVEVVVELGKSSRVDIKLDAK
jgi:hypothetical protein